MSRSGGADHTRDQVAVVQAHASSADSVGDRQLLLDYLRQDHGHTSINTGCGIGVCGACTVLTAGGPVRSCLVLSRDFDGLDVRTLENLTITPLGISVAEAFGRNHALQCGYCTPGFMILAIDMVESGEPQSSRTVRELVSGNLCRCTGYSPIISAMREIAEAAGLWIPGEEGIDDLFG